MEVPLLRGECRVCLFQVHVVVTFPSAVIPRHLACQYSLAVSTTATPFPTAPGQPFDVGSSPRRFSNTVPAIFARPGVKTLLTVAEAQRLFTAPQAQEGTDDRRPVPMVESSRVSSVNYY